MPKPKKWLSSLTYQNHPKKFEYYANQKNTGYSSLNLLEYIAAKDELNKYYKRVELMVASSSEREMN